MDHRVYGNSTGDEFSVINDPVDLDLLAQEAILLYPIFMKASLGEDL